MALVFHSGFEISDFSEWTTTGGTLEVQGVIKHTGDYAMRCNPVNANGYVTNSVARRRVSFYLYIVDAPSADVPIAGRDGFDYWHIRLHTDRKLELRDDDGDSTPGLTVLDTETWYRISMSVDSSGNCKVYLNGVEEISGSDVSSVNGRDTVGILSGALTADLYFDDYVSDDTDSTNDIGDIRVVRAQPSGVGTYNQYDISSGFGNVDECPANDGDFVEDNQAGIARECYALPDCDALGMAGGDTVEAVSVWIRGDRDGGGATDHKAMVRDNGNDYESANFAFDAIAWFNWYLAVMPDDSAAWTRGRWNSLEAGCYHHGGQDQRVHCVMLMVAFMVAAAPPVHIPRHPATIFQVPAIV